MTTTVIVQANHGWPVKVTKRNTGSNAPDGPYPTPDSVEVVPAGETRQFYVHSTLDLEIHEIQPSEQPASDEKTAA